MIQAASLLTEAATEVVASARTMEVEVPEARALLACPPVSPARCLRVSRQLRPVTRPPHQEPPALASPQHHPDTWLRLRPRTTLQPRLDTDLLHHRRTHPHLRLATPRRRLSTLLRRPTTAQRPRRSWVARLLQRTVRHHHNTARRRRSTVLQVLSTRPPATGVLRLHRRHRNTARRRHATRQRARQGPFPRPLRATARLLRAQPTLLHLQSNSWLDDVGRLVSSFLSCV